MHLLESVIVVYWLAVLVGSTGAAPAAAGSSPAPSERARVALIRAGKQNGIDPKFAEAVHRLDTLQAGLEFDDTGNLIGIDLASGRQSVADADIETLTALPHLMHLRLYCSGVTNAGAKRISTMTILVELALLNSQIDNDGLSMLTALGNLS